MPRTLITLLYAGLVPLLLLLAACDDSDGDAPTDADALTPAATSDGGETPTASPTTDSPGSPTEASQGAGAASDIAWDDSVLVLRDGVWPVGDAGEVEFAVVGAGLELIDVRPAAGWTVTDQEVEADEIEVDFRRENVDWTIEVEIDDGVLEIEIDQDLHDAEPGTYTVGLAGTVAFDVTEGALRLGEIVTNEGWSHTVEEQDDDEIDVDFRMGDVKWEFKVEQDDGRLEVEIDFEIEGRYPPA